MPTDDGFEEWFDSTGLTNAKEMSATFDAGNEYAAFKMLIRAAWQAAVKHERERAARVVEAWAEHYPTDVFIEPPPGEHGETVDACSARAIRRMCPNIAAAIRGGGEVSQ